MRYVLLCVFCVLKLTLLANETYVVHESLQEISLQDYAYHFEDTTHTLSIYEVENEKWERINGPTVFPNNMHIQWLKYKLANPENNPVNKVLYIPYHLIYEVDVFAQVDSIITPLASSGVQRSYSAKYLGSMGYAVPIHLNAKSTTTLFLRLNFLYRPLRATTYLMSEKRVRKVIKDSNNIIWLWRGVFLFALFISLLFYSFVHLKIFLYYFLLNVGVALFISSQIGDYFLFFDADPTGIIIILDSTGAMLINLFLPLFINALSPIKERNKKLWKWMYYFIYIGAALVLINHLPAVRNSFLLFYIQRYVMLLSSVVFILQLVFLSKNSYLKIKNAIPTFIIYSIYVSTAFAEVILPNMGVVSDTPFVLKTLLFSSFFEIVSFMALMGTETIAIYKDRSALLYKQKQHQKEIIFSMVSSQEIERNRVGRELHDLIGANMAILKQKVSKENLELYKVVEQTIDDVRMLSNGLVTTAKHEDDFADEIKEMCKLFSTNNMAFHSYFHNWKTIKDTELNTHLYRIIQELLQNASKHSHAENVHLQLIRNNSNEISLIYEDDGIGFNASQKHKGLGLNNIKHRVQLLNGDLQIDTKPNGKGTSLIIEVAI